MRRTKLSCHARRLVPHYLRQKSGETPEQDVGYLLESLVLRTRLSCPNSAAVGVRFCSGLRPRSETGYAPVQCIRRSPYLCVTYLSGKIVTGVTSSALAYSAGPKPEIISGRMAKRCGPPPLLQRWLSDAALQMSSWRGIRITDTGVKSIKKCRPTRHTGV